MRRFALGLLALVVVIPSAGYLYLRQSLPQTRGELVLAGLRAETEVLRANAQRDLVAAPPRSEDVAEAEARVAELTGRLRELDALLAEAVVKAPEPAVVEVLAVRPGDIVAPNQPVARVLRRRVKMALVTAAKVSASCGAGLG